MPIGLESKAAFSSSFPFFSVIQLILILFFPYSQFQFQLFWSWKKEVKHKKSLNWQWEMCIKTLIKYSLSTYSLVGSILGARRYWANYNISLLCEALWNVCVCIYIYIYAYTHIISIIKTLWVCTIIIPIIHTKKL